MNCIIFACDGSMPGLGVIFCVMNCVMISSPFGSDACTMLPTSICRSPILPPTGAVIKCRAVLLDDSRYLRHEFTITAG